jgi:hypothetical protein
MDDTEAEPDGDHSGKGIQIRKGNSLGEMCQDALIDIQSLSTMFIVRALVYSSYGHCTSPSLCLNNLAMPRAVRVCENLTSTMTSGCESHLTSYCALPSDNPRMIVASIVTEEGVKGNLAFIPEQQGKRLQR